MLLARKAYGVKAYWWLPNRPGCYKICANPTQARPLQIGNQGDASIQLVEDVYHEHS